MVPVANKEKLYNLRDLPKLTNTAKGADTLVLGAGGAPWPFLRQNGEVMFGAFSRLAVI